jgi:putative restriction endonuclease
MEQSGYLMWRFRLEALEAFSPQERSTDQEQVPPPRGPQTVQRIVRDTALSRHIKELHDFTCQVCGERLGLPTNPYAEAAHIRPLGEPHNGPDVRENILCLCPNHHVLFDLGAFTIDDDLTLISLPGALRTISRHKIGLDYVRYHRDRYGSV